MNPTTPRKRPLAVVVPMVAPSLTPLPPIQELTGGARQVTKKKRKPPASTSCPLPATSGGTAAQETDQMTQIEDVPFLRNLLLPSFLPSPRSILSPATKRKLWKVDSIQGLLNIAGDRDNHIWPEVRKLMQTVPVLLKIDEMVGQEKIKRALVDHVVYFCQSFERKEMLNVCLVGGPGLGKTKLCELLCDLYQSLKILPHYEGDYPDILPNTEEKFLIGNRVTMNARYLGQTAIKTKQLIDRCIKESKILLMDEVYQMNNTRADDSFSKEAIDTLNQQLSENAGKLICIVAGYEGDVDKCFFATNRGLRRRFQYRYKFEDYKPVELAQILALKAEEQDWVLDSKMIKTDFFETHKDAFIHQAADMETLFVKSKIVHARRVFGTPECDKRRLTLQDLETAFEEFVKDQQIEDQSSFMHMYL